MANRRRTDGEKLRRRMDDALAAAAAAAGTPGMVWDPAEEAILDAACRAADNRQRLGEQLAEELAGAAGAVKLARLSNEIRQLDVAVVRNVRLLQTGLDKIGVRPKRMGSVQRISELRGGHA